MIIKQTNEDTPLDASKIEGAMLSDGEYNNSWKSITGNPSDFLHFIMWALPLNY